MKKNKYLNFSLFCVSKNEGEDDEELIVSIDTSSGRLPMDLIKVYNNLKSVECGDIVNTIGSYEFFNSMYYDGYIKISYINDTDRRRKVPCPKYEYLFSENQLDGGGKVKTITPNIEFSIDCVVGILSCTVYVDETRYVGNVLISELMDSYNKSDC